MYKFQLTSTILHLSSFLYFNPARFDFMKVGFEFSFSILYCCYYLVRNTSIIELRYRGLLLQIVECCYLADDHHLYPSSTYTFQKFIFLAIQSNHHLHDFAKLEYFSAYSKDYDEFCDYWDYSSYLWNQNQTLQICFLLSFLYDGRHYWMLSFDRAGPFLQGNRYRHYSKCFFKAVYSK